MYESVNDAGLLAITVEIDQHPLCTDFGGNRGIERAHLTIPSNPSFGRNMPNTTRPSYMRNFEISMELWFRTKKYGKSWSLWNSGNRKQERKIHLHSCFGNDGIATEACSNSMGRTTNGFRVRSHEWNGACFLESTMQQVKLPAEASVMTSELRTCFHFGRNTSWLTEFPSPYTWISTPRTRRIIRKLRTSLHNSGEYARRFERNSSLRTPHRQKGEWNDEMELSKNVSSLKWS